MSYSFNERGLRGRQLYIAVAAWLVLVIVGGFCTWYGWDSDFARKRERKYKFGYFTTSSAKDGG